MTYTNATKDTYVPPACSKCGAPSDVDWADVTAKPLPPHHPDRELVPGRTVCSARCWQDGHITPPCPRCGADGQTNWPEVTTWGDVERSFTVGSHWCTSRCSENLPYLERRELHERYPGWEW